MAAGLPSARKNIKQQKREKADRHGWNSFENYKQVHYTCLTNHSFVDPTKPLPEFEQYRIDNDILIRIEGDIYCYNNVILSITKTLETKAAKDGRLKVRCFSYSYNARVAGKHNILRYDNGHYDNGHEDFNYYHKHIFDWRTGKEINIETLTREKFPLLSEVLSELEDLPL